MTVYDAGETEGESPEAFIVMELLPGGTVADRLCRAEPIPHATALRWLSDAAGALDAAHHAGIVHRDVKPANLLLDEDGGVRVADFGIAKSLGETTVTLIGQVVGTSAYLSPEQALGRAATPASDRYALAVVAFELLTGRRPFVAEHPFAQAQAHVDREAPRATDVAPSLPPAVDHVLAAGLAKDPRARPATATDLADGLRDAFAAAGSLRTAVPPQVPRRITPRPGRARATFEAPTIVAAAPKKHHRGLALVTAALTALFIATGALLALGPNTISDDATATASGITTATSGTKTSTSAGAVGVPAGHSATEPEAKERPEGTPTAPAEPATPAPTVVQPPTVTPRGPGFQHLRPPGHGYGYGYRYGAGSPDGTRSGAWSGRLGGNG